MVNHPITIAYWDLPTTTSLASFHTLVVHLAPDSSPFATSQGLCAVVLLDRWPLDFLPGHGLVWAVLHLLEQQVPLLNTGWDIEKEHWLLYWTAQSGTGYSSLSPGWPSPAGLTSLMVAECSIGSLGLDGQCTLYSNGHRFSGGSDRWPTQPLKSQVLIYHTSFHGFVVCDLQCNWADSPILLLGTTLHLGPVRRHLSLGESCAQSVGKPTQGPLYVQSSGVWMQLHSLRSKCTLMSQGEEWLGNFEKTGHKLTIIEHKS